MKEPVKVSRDLDVVQIPQGYQVRLARGTEVRVSQALGDTFTVITEYGTMVRIAGKDADAIGETAPPEPVGAGPRARPQLDSNPPSALGQAQGPAPTTVLTPDEIKEQVWTALRGVYDPEIPVSVVELGLVYSNEVIPLPEGGYRVDVKMTLTAPGCGMGPVLKDDAERRIRAIPGVQAVNVEMVIDPPWNISMMSEAARLELGL
jgi:probable FeS assembly SUF system protein SufT